MKRIIFVPRTESKIVKSIGRGYFVKMSFRKDCRIIFPREKIGFKRNYLKSQGEGGARGEHGRGRPGRGGLRDWAGSSRAGKGK
jgi:hypothetical protein